MSFFKWDHFCHPEDWRVLLFTEWITHPHLVLMGLSIKVLCECKKNCKPHFLVIYTSSCCHASASLLEEDLFGKSMYGIKETDLMKIHAPQDYDKVWGDGVLWRGMSWWHLSVTETHIIPSIQTCTYPQRYPSPSPSVHPSQPFQILQCYS